MMKRARAIVLVSVLVFLAGAGSSPARAEVSFDFFYSNLSPYGAWRVSAEYGRVWQPRVYAAEWNPYYDGHWVYADVGWTWVSDYEWGGIPYHYGTWVDDPEVGWVWVPGYVWAPAWVVFRTGPDYIGWAPVSPGFTVGFSAGFGARAAGPFVFVSARDFLAPRVRSCYVPASRTTVIINNTRIVNTLVVERNVVVNRGPDLRIIERASGRKVREVPIERVSGVGPGRRITRDEIAVATRGSRHALRAAEPVAASRTLPENGQRVDRRPDRPVERGTRDDRRMRSRIERPTTRDQIAEGPSVSRPPRPERPQSQNVVRERERTRERPEPNRQQRESNQKPPRKKERPPRHQDHDQGHH